MSCADDEYRAEYFANRTLSGTPVEVRCEAAIDNDWGAGGPVAGTGTDTFSVRWTRRPTFPGGATTFRVTGDDGVRVRLDGVTVIDGWKDQGTTTYTAERTVPAGAHEIVVEYYEAGGDAVARFSWAAAAGQPTCATEQFLAEYFPNRTLTGDPVLVRCESAIDHDWGRGAPAPELAANNFSVRWTRTQSFPGGPVTFGATGDDGVRIAVDGRVVVDGWRDQAATAYTATTDVTGGRHQVRVEYYEAWGDAVARASWR